MTDLTVPCSSARLAALESIQHSDVLPSAQNVALRSVCDEERWTCCHRVGQSDIVQIDLINFIRDNYQMNRRVTKNFCIFLAVIPFYISGCGGGGSGSNSNTQIKSLSDARFIGEFNYAYDYVAQDGINESHLKDTLIFNGTNLVENKRYKKIYNAYNGWIYTGSYIGDWLNRTLEFDTSNGLFRYRVANADNNLSLWGRDSNQWSSWQRYEFSTDGAVLKLYGDYANNAFSNESLTLTKRGVYIPQYGQNSAEVINLSAALQTSTVPNTKEYLISWSLSGLAQIKGVSYEVDSSNNFTSTMNPLPTSFVLSISPGETKIFSIKTIDIEGDYSNGLSISVSY